LCAAGWFGAVTAPDPSDAPPSRSPAADPRANRGCVACLRVTAQAWSSMVAGKGKTVLSSYELLARIYYYIPVQLSLSVHEWAHARVAFALGDDTAAREGRLTLNPIVHMDLLGTIIPLMGVPFGWAKPVPVNPARFRRGISMRTGMMLTAAAGPLSNVALAILCFAVLAVMMRLAAGTIANTHGIQPLLAYAGIVNLSLAVFNLLPIFPLDGSRIVDGMMPYRWREGWERMSRLSPVLLMLVIFILPRMGLDVFAWVHWAGGWMLRIARG
jgi:Zn-dependent protease